MEFELELSNYRCFPISRPAKVRIGPGFTSFVGINNSGKSSILRFFYEFRPIFAHIAANPGVLTANLPTSKFGLPGVQGVADPEEVFCNANEQDLAITLSLETDPVSSVQLVLYRQASNFTLQWTVGGEPAEPQPGGVRNSRGEEAQPERYAALCDALARSLYFGPFRNAINVGSANYYDLRIGSAFVEQWAEYKSGSVKRQNRSAIALTEEIRRIFGLETLELNATPDKQTLQVIADRQSYRLDEQGAGLAQFIVVLAYAATQSPPFIFIDEPELNLHPSLQLDFLTTLTRFSTVGTAFATHSLGLARAGSTSVYSFQRLGPAECRVSNFEGTTNLAEFLGELSYSGYQELGYQTILLVEGKTDVPLIQQWLRRYGAEHKVVILPLGGCTLINGDSIQELEQVARLSDDVWVLIDSEREAEGDPLEAPREAFIKNCHQLNFETCVLERRATENYLSTAAVKSVKGKASAALRPYGTLKDAGYPWGKRENWRIGDRMSTDELEQTDLGQFLLRVAAAVQH